MHFYCIFLVYFQFVLTISCFTQGQYTYLYHDPPSFHWTLEETLKHLRVHFMSPLEQSERVHFYCIFLVSVQFVLTNYCFTQGQYTHLYHDPPLFHWPWMVMFFYVFLKFSSVETPLVTLITQHFRKWNPIPFDIIFFWGFYCSFSYIWFLIFFLFSFYILQSNFLFFHVRQF